MSAGVSERQKEIAYEALVKSSLNMMAGGIAGAVSRTMTSPIERLKVMQQVQTRSNEYKGVLSGLRHMYVTEGWRGFFKGNGTNVARIAPYSAFQFYFYDMYKTAFLHAERTFGHRAWDDDSQLSPGKKFCAGALGGASATLLCYPLDIARSYLTLQTASKTEAKYKGIFHVITSVYKTDGMRGLFRGAPIALFGITPYNAINFATFDMLKTRYLPPSSDPYFTWINLLLGGIAGGTAALATYPTDVIKRRMQLQGVGRELVKELPQYNGAIDCVRVVLRTEGIVGLYRGLTACLLKVIPSMAIAFTIHESLRSALKFDIK